MRFQFGLFFGAVVSDAAACPAEVVQQASLNDFMQYVLLNCVIVEVTIDTTTNLVTYKNYLSTTPLSAEACLYEFMKANAARDSDPIPTAGSCRDAFQQLVYALSVLDATSSSFLTDCPLVSGAVTVSDDCVQNQLKSALTAFKTASGHSMTFQQCSAYTVRTLSGTGKDAYGTIVKSAVAATGVSDKTSNLVSSTTDKGDGFCYSCYHAFYDSVIATPYGSASGMKTACQTSPTAELCFGSTQMSDALVNFKTCSGGYDLIWSSPVCAQTDIDLVEDQYFPTPYLTLTQCVFQPEGRSFCKTILSFFDGIRQVSSCVLCYQDYYAEVVRGKTSARSACTAGANGIWDEACLSVQATALANFKACSGFAMNTEVVTITTTTPAPVGQCSKGAVQAAGIPVLAVLVVATAATSFSNYL